MRTTGTRLFAAGWLLILLPLALLSITCDNADQSQAQQEALQGYTIDLDGELVAQVDAGGDETCVVTTNSNIYCWGGHEWGPRLIRDVRHELAGTWSPERTVVDISVGPGSACAVDDLAVRLCWYPSEGRFSHAIIETRSRIDVAVGAEMWCGISREGRASCSQSASSADRAIRTDYEVVRRTLVNYTALSAGDFHVCGLTDEGIVYCWGHNGAGQIEAPQGEFKSIGSGRWHSCAIDQHGEIVCWGDNSHGQSLSPDGAFKAVAPGGRHTCAITSDGALVCWGDNSRNQSEPPPGEWISVSSGHEHSCAISTEQALACWGSNEHGQTDIPGGKWVQVDLGAIEDWGTEFCALREDGVVACANNLLVFGLRGWDTPTVPRAPGGRWSAIDLGSNQRCLQDERLQVQCWRWNEREGPVTEYLAPIPHSDAGYLEFSAGGIYVCMIDDRQILRCARSSGSWDADFANKLNPQPVTVWPGRFTDLAMGYRHVCAVDIAGDVECIQLDRIADQSLLPDLPPLPDPGEPVAALNLDANASWGCQSHQEPECPDPPGCLLTRSGQAYCWGRGSGDRWSISAQAAYIEVSVGCGLEAAGVIACWDGTEPLLDQDTGPFTSLGSSSFSHCATTARGDIHCWGDIGIVIEDRELKPGAFHVPGVKIAALRPSADAITAERRTR